MYMEKIQVRFPDGREASYPRGISLEEVAQSISPHLRKSAAAGIVNGKLVDLKSILHEDASLELVMLQSKEGTEVMRKTAAQVLAQSIKRLFNGVNLGEGAVVENGFYYEAEVEESISVQDLAEIEKEMKKIINENLRIEREEVTRQEAEAIFTGDALKLEQVNEFRDGENISIYRHGEFVDLSSGPLLPSTKMIPAFQLTHVSGAYWKGDSSNKVLQRIYGIAFSSQEELKKHLHFVDEAQKRNHRKVGKELELFIFSEEAPGMPFFLPNGLVIRNKLEEFLRSLQFQFDYQEVRTPIMMNQGLWEQSGHWDHYKENMYFSEVDHQRFALKPMNCPGAMMIYRNSLRSYRDLPIRMAEFGQVHRHEFSGALNGMLRVRSFCQDDAHLFVTPEQIEEEIVQVLKLIDQVYRTFGFDYSIELSTRPSDFMGEEALWDQAETALKNVLNTLKLPYHVNEGDGAFYGPKIDVHIKDALQRSHQCATVQLDFQMPEKFDLSYINEKNEKSRPVVIHRAVFGSIDRFLGILIEHYGGAFPLWLAPVQVKILPVSNEAHQAYAKKVLKQLKQQGIRTELDLREEKLGYKMREAQLKKIPYLLVIGDKEVENETVNLRVYGEEGVREVDLIHVSQEIKRSSAVLNG
ncbi:threonine--tRNA ligase [Jeotgalibacillus proteolyticus]|uniref:threonine--tRNA ligase n=1 Tax=Jeotgalibacillus proteolyticus TaxID=2082395 RepID=UPI003CF85F0E